MRRGLPWNTSSPQRSASFTALRAPTSAGRSGGSGLSSSSALAIARVPWILRPSTVSAGTVALGKRSARRTGFAIIGIRSTRSYSSPFRSSISRAVNEGCEPGITYSRALKVGRS